MLWVGNLEVVILTEGSAQSRKFSDVTRMLISGIPLIGYLKARQQLQLYILSADLNITLIMMVLTKHTVAYRKAVIRISTAI